MKTKLLATIVLILGCFVVAAEEKEIIKDKSPDERFHARQPILGPSVINAAR